MSQTKENVLIVTYDMIPYSSTWGGAQRMYYLAEFLVKNGLEVTVFSCKKNNKNDYGNDINFINRPIEIKNRFFRNFISSKGNNKKFEEGKKNKSHKLIKQIRQFGKNNAAFFKIVTYLDKKVYNEPGFLAGFISRSWSSSTKRNIVEYARENKIKNIIISAPPFGMFSIAKYLKKELKDLNLILDYRDPWNLWHDRSYFANTLEKKYLKIADHIVFTNKNLAQDMAKRFNISKCKINIIENGYSGDAWNDSDLKRYNRGNSMELTYVGVMDMSLSSHYGYRDISILLNAFEKCLNEGKKITLKFVGISNPDSEYSKNIKKKFGDRIKIIGVLDNREANKIMIESDALLLLHTTQDNSSKYLISGKMYDYIKANKFIFSIGSSDGLHHEIINKENIGVSSENNFNDIYENLKYTYSLWEENNLNISLENTIRYSREFQNEKYLNLITK